MYKNLVAQMAESGVTRRDIAKVLGKHENSIGLKVSGKSPFTIEEAFKIKSQLFPDADLKYLFEQNATDQ